MTSQAPARAGRREWAGLAVLALPTLLVSMDVTVLYLAVPQLSADLGPSSIELLWIMDVYGFLIAGALVPMGVAGDRYGRRKLLLAGATLFGVASVLAAYADSPQTLIAARALLGLAGATLMPSTLSLVRVMFVDPAQRGVAIAVVMTSFSVGTTVGPLLGGLLLEFFWWGSVFLLGVPVMLLLLVLGPLLLPEYRDPESGRVDPTSVLLSIGSMIGVVYAVKETAAHGFAWTTVSAGVTGLALGTWFVRRQLALTEPLLDLALLRDRVINTSLGTYLLGMFAMGGTQVFIALYLQEVLGLSPLLAGVWMVPASLGTVAGSMLAPVLVRRWRPSVVIAAGLTLAGAGFGVLGAAGPHDLTVLVLGYLMVALGLSPMITLCTDLVIGAAPSRRAGAASAMSESSGELGVALGVALLGSLGTAVYRTSVGDGLPAGLPAGAADTVRKTLGGAESVAADLPGSLAEPLLAASRQALTQGLNVTAAAAGVVTVATAVWAGLRLRGVPVTRATGPREAGDPDAPGSSKGPDEPDGTDGTDGTEGQTVGRTM
ncbi:MFS transporter [Streptomyces sp. NPDC059578]|uniref:MFS transporter n=1 Tax=unclassified Streptomyces TaxID=2593676 RepID=UPI003655FEFF